jgi:hypothetical protein
MGRDGDCFRLGWGRPGFRDSRFCNLACACVFMGFGLRSGDAAPALQGGESNLIEYVGSIPPV